MSIQFPRVPEGTPNPLLVGEVQRRCPLIHSKCGRPMFASGDPELPWLWYCETCFEFIVHGTIDIPPARTFGMTMAEVEDGLKKMAMPQIVLECLVLVVLMTGCSCRPPEAIKTWTKEFSSGLILTEIEIPESMFENKKK